MSSAVKIIDSEEATSLKEDTAEPPPSPMVAEGYLLKRAEVFLFPTVITDKHGNTVTYTYDPTNRWQLKSIIGTDVAGSPRTITISYASTTSKLISAVTDGTRTWSYAYSPAPHNVLTSVTLPDNSSWQLGGLKPFITELNYASGGSCEQSGYVTNGPVTGSMMHPSGATGEFTLTPTKHGRTGVLRECYTTLPSNEVIGRYFKEFDTFAMTRKTIAGPGLPLLEWTTTFPPAESSFQPCPAEGCTPFKTVEVKSPSGSVTRHKFGTLFRVNEGLPLGTEVLDALGNSLRTIVLEYQQVSAPRGVSDQGRGDGEFAARTMENSLTETTQQGVTFTKKVNNFSSFAQPAVVTRSSNLGSRTESIFYNNNRVKWILGQIDTISINDTALVPVKNTYSGTASNLTTSTKFGKLEKTFAYHADGTISSAKDGKNQTTGFTSYKRGIPQTVTYANNTTEIGVVDNIGNVRSVTDEVGYTTNYGYDAIGRIESITHPSQDTVAWLPTTFTFARSAVSHQMLPAGHWVQKTTTGNALSTTYYDALWRPVYTEKSDKTDSSGTMGVVIKEYDNEGQVSFESYPKRTYAQGTTGTYTAYDALGRVTETKQDSELGVISVTNEYAAGFVRKTKDARGNTTTTTFQAFDQPSEAAITSITAPAPLDGIVINISRDILGKTNSITRSAGSKIAKRSYVYDDNQQLCKTIEPETDATIQAYDAANNVVWRAAGLPLLSTTACDTASVTASQKMSFGYDSLNRLLNTTFGDGSPGIVRTYTADGLLETISSGGSIWTNGYNKRRLHASESLSYGGRTYNIGRVFDAYGSLAQMTYPGSNLTVAFNPNALGQPRQVGPYASGVTYHPNGALAGFTYGNGIQHSLTQNVRGLPEQSADVGVIRDVYAYDKNANVASITDDLKSVNSRSMGYDELNRMTTVSAPGLWGNAVYGYDGLDNLVSTSITGGATARSITHTIDPVTNRLASIGSNLPGATTAYNFDYGYDAQGNITQRGSQRFVFDQGNRMTSATGRATYAYDGLGHRFSTVGSDGVNRIQIYTQAGQLLYTAPSAGVGTNYIYLGRHQIAEVKK